MTKHHFKFADGTTNQLTLWIPDESAYAVFLILPAMGTRASYYRHFAAHFSSHGVAVATIDWRGHGESSVRPDHGVDWGYSQLIDDVQEVCWLLKKRIHFNRLFLLGHSKGGQVAHLSAAKFSGLIDGVFSVASSDPYFRQWKWYQQLPFYFASMLVYPISLVIGHFPGYFFGFARREAKTMIRDWGRAVRNGNFKLRGDSFNYEKAKEIYSGKIVAISIEDDILAPYDAVEFTMKFFPNATLKQHVELSQHDEKGNRVTHFSWAKHSDGVIGHILEALEG